MKMNTRSCKQLLALLASVVSFGAYAQTQTNSVVYDNSTTPLGGYLYSANEFGDEITLSDSSVDRWITNFKFEYFLGHNASGNEKAVLRIYDGTGTGITAPGALLFESDAASLVSGYRTGEIPGLADLYIQVPQEIVWTIQFTGIETGESGGLLYYDPPTVGSSFDDYWEKTGSGWVLKQPTEGSGVVANFGAQVVAMPIPEPTTIQLGLLAGLTWVGSMVARRRKA